MRPLPKGQVFLNRNEVFMKKHFLLLVGLLVALPVSAEGIYVFGDAGRSTFAVDVEGWDFSRKDSTYAVGLGYELNQTFSFELAYRDLGKVEFNFGDSKSQADGSTIQASVLAKYPVSPAVNIFGRAGISRLDYETSYQYPDFPDERGSETKNKAFYGLGATYAVNEKISLRAEYNRHAEWDDVIISTMTIGAVYKF